MNTEVNTENTVRPVAPVQVQASDAAVPDRAPSRRAADPIPPGVSVPAPSAPLAAPASNAGQLVTVPSSPAPVTAPPSAPRDSTLSCHAAAAPILPGTAPTTDHSSLVTDHSQLSSSSSLQSPASGLPFSPAPNEPPHAFGAFLVYFRLPGKRRLTAVARKTGAGLRTVYRWASEFDWAGRVNRYQAGLLQQRAQLESDLHSDEIIAWSDRSSAIREREWEIADDLLHALQHRLRAGDLDEAALATIARTLSQVSKIARLTTGLKGQPTDDTDATDPREAEFEAALQTAYGTPPPKSP